MFSIKIPTPIIIWFDFHFVILFTLNARQSDFITCYSVKNRIFYNEKKSDKS